MESRFKRKIFIIITILMMLCSLPKVVKAAPVVFNVSTGAEFLQAIDDINNGTETDYVISLKANIDVLTNNFIELARGNTTILGNGYEITNIYGFIVYSINPNLYTTLTLGQQDGANILKINGSYTGTSGPDTMFWLDGNCILNMHQGVEIYSRNIPLVYYAGFIFYVGLESTLNMYGGSIKNCFVEKTTTEWCSMICVDGEFNMSGGEISGNTVQDSSTDDNDVTIDSAVIVSQAGTINITGGSIINNKIILNGAGSRGRGAAINVFISTVNISNATISGNEIRCNNVNNVNNCCGGAIYADRSAIAIENSVIINNKVISNYGYGGGIVAEYDSILTITDSLVAFNTASYSASDIYFYSELGSELYLPVAFTMNSKQTTPYMNLITGWYEDNDGNRWSMTNQTTEFTTLQNGVISGQYKLVAGYEKAQLITYNSNGGQGADYYQNLGANILALDNAVVGFTRTNYEFTGWNTAADGSGTAYAAGASLPPTDLGFTLYAQWKAKPVTPDTGDVFNPNIFMSLMILSGIGLVVLNKRYKKQENN